MKPLDPTRLPEVDSVAGLIAASGIARSEGLRLLGHATGSSREQLMAHPGRRIDAAGLAAFEVLARRRRDGEPMAYLIGHREFYGRDFDVGPGVLIPRPETELLVDLALRHLARSIEGPGPARVLDLGTGSGAIAVTLALECASAEVVATDLSNPALDYARTNAQRLDARVRFMQSDWFAALDRAERFDMIVTNPPYIAGADPHLAAGDLRFEPPTALTDFADGLSALRSIIAGATRWLRAGGVLMVEHGYDQAALVRAEFARNGFDPVVSHRDLSGIERVTSGTTLLGAGDGSPDL